MASPFHQDQCPLTPDSRKKKPALPSLLSNLRNAQAVIGRAADDLHEREIRPLMGGGGGGGSSNSLAASIGPGKMKRPNASTGPGNVSSARGPSAQRGGGSFTATLQNYSTRFGSQWRKRNKKDATGKTYRVSVPHSFLICVVCLFFGFPMLFLLYMLARQAVFGDEGVTAGANEHKYEVPSIANDFVAGVKNLSGLDTINIPGEDTEELDGIGNSEKKPELETKPSDPLVSSEEAIIEGIVSDEGTSALEDSGDDSKQSTGESTAMSGSNEVELTEKTLQAEHLTSEDSENEDVGLSQGETISENAVFYRSGNSLELEKNGNDVAEEYTESIDSSIVDRSKSDEPRDISLTEEFTGEYHNNLRGGT